MAFRFALARILFAAIIVLMLPQAAWADEPGEQIEYVWLTAGQPSGSQTVRRLPDGRLSISFAFNDRGRGPELEAVVTLGEDGLPTGYEATGLNYTKGNVDERFSIEDGVARWRSAIEQGEAPASGDALYLPVNSVPEYRAILARALLARPDRRIDLLPSGSARIDEVTRLALPVEGEEREAILYAISGLDLTPDYVWLDAENELIGFDLAWFAVLRAGWTDHLPALKSAQEEALARHVRAEAERLGRRIDGPVAIDNVRIVDVESGRLGEPSNVLLQDGAIARIGPPGADVPEGAHRIDGTGLTLMPALWDMHAHIDPSAYLHYVASGVLNVRDMANDPAFMARARADVAGGTVAAPDIHPLGFIDRRGPYSAPTGQLADTLDEALAFVGDYARDGYRGIKLYSSIDPQWVPRLTAEARRLGLTTLGHIPAFMSTEQAIRDGYGEVTHVNMILLQLIGDWSIDTRTPQRFIVPGERGGTLDLDSAQATAFIDLMVERNIAHDPTLAIFMDQYRSRPGEIVPHAAAYADHLPPALRRAHIADAGFNQGQEEAFARTGEVALRLIRRLHDRGVRLLPGTDSGLPGFALVSELEYYAEAGIPNADIVRMATLGAAGHMGLAETLGSVAPGKRAHLILIEGDPLQDLSALRRVRFVIKDDALFDASEILRAQGIRPF